MKKKKNCWTCNQFYNMQCDASHLTHNEMVYIQDAHCETVNIICCSNNSIKSLCRKQCDSDIAMEFEIFQWLHIFVDWIVILLIFMKFILYFESFWNE